MGQTSVDYIGLSDLVILKQTKGGLCSTNTTICFSIYLYRFCNRIVGLLRTIGALTKSIADLTTEVGEGT